MIEAAPEDLELKRSLFAELAELCGPEAILATNTSSLSVTAIAAGVERPGAGVRHALLQPARADAPGRDRRRRRDIRGDAGRRHGGRAGDGPRADPRGRRDRLRRQPARARPFTLEALRLLGERIAPHDQIDRIVRIGGGFRMGPFELMDLVGVDVNFEVAKSFWEQSFHEPRWQPHPIQARMVAAGRLGRKAGRGYYDYRDGPHRPDDPSAPEPDRARGAGRIDRGPPRSQRIDRSRLHGAQPPGRKPRALDPGGRRRLRRAPALAEAGLVEIDPRRATTPERLGAAERHFARLGKHVEWVPATRPGLVLGRILCQIVNEAHFAVQAGVATAEDVDTAMRLGFN